MWWPFRKPPQPRAEWVEKAKDDMAADLADLACNPEGWRSVVIVAVDTEGGTMISRYRSKDASGMEALGSVQVAAKLLQMGEVGRFEDE